MTVLPVRAVRVQRVVASRRALRAVLRWWPAALLTLAVLVTAYYTLRQDRDFWYDEAMLVQALRADPWLAPWQPMSSFEQASPYGVYLVQKALLQVVGFSPDLLRLPGLVAYALGGLATWRAARAVLGPATAALAGVLALCSLVAVQSSGDFKHYVFEYAIAAVLLWLGVRASSAASPPRRLIELVTAGVIALPFSNTVVLVLPGVLVAVVLAARPRGRRLLRVVVAAAAFVAAFAVWYLVSIRPSTVYQVAYPTYRQTSTVDLYWTLVQGVAQPSAAFAYSIATVTVVGLGVSVVWVRSLLPAFAPVLVAVLLGWAGVRTGLIPISADRHLLFLVPLLAFAAGAAMRALWIVASQAFPPQPHRGLATAAVAAVLALAAVATIQPNATVLRQQAGQALTEYSERCSSFYVDWWTQPATTLYASSSGMLDRIGGTVDVRSGAGQQAWAYRVMNHPAAYQRGLVRQVRSSPGTCVLTGGREDEQALVFAPLAAAGLACEQIGVVAGIQITTCRRGGAA